MAERLLIYSNTPSLRKEYIFKTLFDDMLGIPIHLTQDKNHYITFSGPKISYGKEPLDEGIHFGEAGLLDENDIATQNLVLSSDKSLTGFFPVKSGVLSFDLFATAFFLLTRYEEYLPHTKDALGRYKSENSCLVKNHIVNKPVVDEYIFFLYELLSATFPALHIQRPEYQFIPTYDIDIAYAYKYKGPWRTLGGMGKDIITFNFPQWKERVSTLLGFMPDPYDTYRYLNQLHERYALYPVYFFPVGKYGKRDKHPSPKHRKYYTLIQKTAHQYAVGLHPTFHASLTGQKTICKEKVILEKIIQQNIEKSRQHYLMLSFPETYNHLLACNIQEDWSMGFPDVIGFRAGTSKPYYWYDLCGNNCTTLKIVPFSVMDATFQHYQNKDANQAKELICQMIDRLKKVGGTFITNFHNNSVSSHPKWKDWKELYIDVVEHAKT